MDFKQGLCKGEDRASPQSFKGQQVGPAAPSSSPSSLPSRRRRLRLPSASSRGAASGDSGDATLESTASLAYQLAAQGRLLELMSVVEGAGPVGGAMAVLRHGVWDEYGRTTLMAAALLGEVEVVRYVLLVVRQLGGAKEGAVGCVVNQRDETGATALLLACMDGTEAVVAALLQAGADPWLCDHEGYSALHAAAGFNHLGAARLLMDQPSSPSQLRALVNRRAAVWGETPLWLAVEQAHADMVALLLSRGAGEEGAQEALEVARQHEGMQAVVKMLLAAAISSSSKQPSGGKLSEEEEEGEAKGLEGEGRVQLFMEACALGLLDEVRGMAAASSGGGLVRARDGERAGMTGLMRAAEAGHTQVVRLLLELGAEVGAEDDHGTSALSLACMEGQDDVVALLCDEGGASVDQRDADGDTPLMVAACGGSGAVLSVLLDRGADVSAVSKGGKTALHWAARHGEDEACRVLLQRGADRGAVDDRGRTAADLALMHGHRRLAKMLTPPVHDHHPSAAGHAMEVGAAE